MASTHADDSEIRADQAPDAERQHWRTWKSPPTDFGVEPALRRLKGGGREENFEIARSILNGAREAKPDIVFVNAAATLVAAGKTANLRHGMALAAGALDSAPRREKLEIRDRLTQAAP